MDQSGLQLGTFMVLLVMAVLDRVEVSGNRTRFEKSY